MFGKKELDRPLPNDAFVDSLISEGKIFPDLAKLLKSIETSTSCGKEAKTSEKIKTVINFRNILKGTDFETGKIANIGSGFDWQFPVALGAENIDMVDILFKEHSSIDKLLASVKLFDLNASLVSKSIPQVNFHINLSDKKRDITLSLYGVFSEDYLGQYKLNGVVESCGPTVHSIKPEGYVYNLPIAQKLIPRMTQNSFIINLDYNFCDSTNDYAAKGLKIIKRGGMKIAQIIDKEKVLKWVQISDKGKPIPLNPSLKR